MQRSNKAFTLIELLVVIAIIAILAAILFPVFAQAKMAAKKTSDLSNVKQSNLGILMYSGDVDDVFPLASTIDSFGNWTPWQFMVNPYVKSAVQTPIPNDFIRGWNSLLNIRIDMGVWRSPLAREINSQAGPNYGPSYGANALVMGEDQSMAPWVNNPARRIPSLNGSQSARPGDTLMTGLTENFTWSGGAAWAFEIPVEWTRPEQIVTNGEFPVTSQIGLTQAALWYRDRWVGADLSWENQLGPGALGTWFCTWGPFMCKGLRYPYAQSTPVSYIDGHAKVVKLGSLRVWNIFPQEFIPGVY